MSVELVEAEINNKTRKYDDEVVYVSVPTQYLNTKALIKRMTIRGLILNEPKLYVIPDKSGGGEPLLVYAFVGLTQAYQWATAADILRYLQSGSPFFRVPADTRNSAPTNV
jgi:hypothetical protein